MRVWICLLVFVSAASAQNEPVWDGGGGPPALVQDRPQGTGHAERPDPPKAGLRDVKALRELIQSRARDARSAAQSVAAPEAAPAQPVQRRRQLEADVARVASNLQKLNADEDEALSAAQSRARLLEKTLRERDDEMRQLRPRAQALEMELDGAREEAKSLSSLNTRLKERLSTIRRSLGQVGAADPPLQAPLQPEAAA